LTSTDPIATQITSTCLGPRPKWTFCSANTALPPTPETPPQSQPVHSDADFDHPTHPFALVVNVPLVAMKPENGSTEIWLGTHTDSGLHVQEGAHGDRASGRIKTHLLDERRQIRPPSQPTVSKGSIIVRDLRLWHCGRGNWTQEARVMLASSTFSICACSENWPD
jgi:ectoine hydroxylase-related dioxygenase (phytanoyl-CoA dioxygenase family)